MKTYCVEIHEAKGDKSLHGKVNEFRTKSARREFLQEKFGRDITKESLWVKNLSGAPGISYHATGDWVDMWIGLSSTAAERA